MTQRDDIPQQDPNQEDRAPRVGSGDDRRSEVKPTDNPVPRSPAPDEDAVREGEEKLERVKPY